MTRAGCVRSRQDTRSTAAAVPREGWEACLGCLKVSVTPCQRPLLARVLKYECSSIVSECSSTSAQVLSPILSLLGSSPAKEVAPAMTEIDDQADALPEALLMQLTSDFVASGFGTVGCCKQHCWLLFAMCY